MRAPPARLTLRGMLPGCCLVTAVALGGAPAAPAPAPRGAFSVGADVGVRAARDDLIVPLASTGPVVGFAAHFLVASGPGLLDSGLRFGVAALFDRDGRPAAGLYHALRLGYLPYVHRAPDRWSLAVGPLVAWETDVLWLAKWDDAHAYWIGRRWLGIAARAWRPLGRTMRVDVTAETSLLGFEARPPAYRYNNEDALDQPVFYFADVNRDARFGTLLDWQAVRVEADLGWVPGSRKRAVVPTGWSIGVEQRVAHASSPASAFILQTTARLAYAWGVP